MIGPVRREPTNTFSVDPKMYRPGYNGRHRAENARRPSDFPPVLWIDMHWITHVAHVDSNYTWCELFWCHFKIEIADTAPLDSVVTCIDCLGSRWRFSSEVR